jgi:hypothetical protein
LSIGRLAATRRPDDGHELAFGDIEVDGVESDDSPAPREIFLANSLDGQQRHGDT